MVRIERKLVAEFKCDFNHVMEIINSKLLTRACGHEIVEEDSCVRVRGIPWQCSDHDIVRVFNLKKWNFVFSVEYPNESQFLSWVKYSVRWRIPSSERIGKTKWRSSYQI